MGLLDYYRRFEAMTEQEVNVGLRQRYAEERAKALARIEPLDLSGTTTIELPHSEIVTAITYAARGWSLNRYPDRHATALRRALAERHDLDPAQIAVGDGAAQLLASTAGILLGPGDELVTPWPSYPLFPLMARRAGAGAVPVPGFDPEAILAAVTPQTRVLALCNPNDPTGEHLGVDVLGALLSRLPDTVTVLLDEALADYVDSEPPDASLPLLDAFPRLLIFRTFSKAWGLAGLRCGYVLGARGSETLLESLVPPLGISALAQAGALEAIERCPPTIERRRATVAAERRRIAAALRELPVDAPPSQANVLWLRAARLDGAELASRLEQQQVIVAAGGPLGAEDHIRVSVHRPLTTDRLLRALQVAVRGPS